MWLIAACRRRVRIYYSQSPFAVCFAFVRFWLRWAGLGWLRTCHRIWSPTAGPFNSQSSWRGLRVGDVFINLKDPGERRTVWTSDACPGDPGQSGRWIRQQFQPEKVRLGAKEFKLLCIHLLEKHLRKLSIDDDKTCHYTLQKATRKGKTSSKNSKKNCAEEGWKLSIDDPKR